MTKSYAEQFLDWLVDEGYTHCYFLSGGNIMHLLNAARTRFVCIPVVHEVTAGIAAEYHNALRSPDTGRAFALVTAGPGLTNCTTAIAGAFLESRELLVIGGQVKSTDRASSTLRQRGIQEIDGCSLVAPICKATLQIAYPVQREQVMSTIEAGRVDRKGPVFIEFCLDAQASPAIPDSPKGERNPQSLSNDRAMPDLSDVEALVEGSARPVLLIGGGISRESASKAIPALEKLGIPIMTTWNALDRITFDHPLFLGRPDTWGMRAANLLIQQADLVIAVGARLSLQQTGFAWEDFAPLGSIIHVDIDEAELDKHHPRKARKVMMDGGEFLTWLAQLPSRSRWNEWLEFGKTVLDRIPLDDPENKTAPGFISPYRFSLELGRAMLPEDVLVPCSSGGASTVLMQAFRQNGQKVMNNKALASMGYGLAGAIGASVSNPSARIVLTEGDGGFAQNLQDLGTVAAQSLNVKIFIFCNDGYASIRMTQKNYFNGSWVGCDASTGVGIPSWVDIARGYSIPYLGYPTERGLEDSQLKAAFERPGPLLVAVPIDPDQTYFPKISSSIDQSGTMRSHPLHLMSPPLPPEEFATVAPYLHKLSGVGRE